MIRDVEDKQDAVNVAIVVWGNSVIPSCACGVPDLNSDGVALLKFECFLFVLNSNGDLVVSFELLIYILCE